MKSRPLETDARKLLEAYPRNWGSLFLLRNDDLAAGRYDVARSRYARAFRELTEPEVPQVDASNYRAAVDLALVLIRMREQERANDLLKGCLEVIETLPRHGINGYWITDVRVYSLQQRPQQALAALSQAIDEGWRVFSWLYLQHDPNLDAIRNEPEFRRLHERLHADLAATGQACPGFESEWGASIDSPAFGIDEHLVSMHGKNPRALAVMSDVGIEISGQESTCD